MLVARNAERLADAATEIQYQASTNDAVTVFEGDVGSLPDVKRLKEEVIAWASGMDVLVNCVGQSDRGRASELDAEHVQRLIEVNVSTAVNCVSVLLPLLRESRGSVINIGSLASKLAARYLGGYPLAKHALAGWTQQLRLECEDDGIHVGLVCPGPIRRDDGGMRYADQVAKGDLPDAAAQPGGGAKLKGLDPDVVAASVLRCIDQRRSEIILPRRARLLVIIAAIWPSMGDRLIGRFTSN